MTTKLDGLKPTTGQRALPIIVAIVGTSILGAWIGYDRGLIDGRIRRDAEQIGCLADRQRNLNVASDAGIPLALVENPLLAWKDILDSDREINRLRDIGVNCCAALMADAGRVCVPGQRGY